jgi:hypothetical protein
MPTLHKRIVSLTAAVAASLSVLLAGAPVRGSEEFTSIPLELSAADLTGLRLQEGVIGVTSDALQHRLVGDGATYGVATWPTQVLPIDTSRVSAVAAGASELELRISDDGENWSGWSDAQRVLTQGARFAQLRATVTEGNVLQSPELRLSSDGPSEGYQRAAQVTNPTVRVWATREGLVGGRTANGHRIVERDKFVALPSRKGLATLNGREYQVKLAYKGKTATAPVWDVGPWNSKDDYWNPSADREMFKDLPRFVPQAWAAFNDGHNGGRDMNGRWITFPASIDIADGTFWDELGMSNSDWVDVTFLWINAASPAPLASYPRVLPKPAPGGAATTPTPTAVPEPPAGQRWYFAEGSTQDPFQTWLLLQNPGTEHANVTLTYMLGSGRTQVQTLRLAPTSRQSVFANQVVSNAEFSTRIDSDKPIVAERAMYFRKDGHVSSGVMKPEKRWCFGLGNTTNDTDTWILVQNPGTVNANVVVSFLLEGGGSKRQPMDVPAQSRRSLMTNLVTPNAAFGICVDSEQPVVAERATYGPGGGGDGSTGASVPAANWFFAEGSTRGGASTQLGLANPSTEAASVEISFLLEGGSQKQRTVQVPPMGMVRVNAAETAPDAAFGVSITSTKPIVAERSMSFGPSGAGSHSSIGSSVSAKTWYLAEGSTASPFQEYLAIANPGTAIASVNVDFMRAEGSVVTRTFPVQPRSRATIDANAVIPNEAVSVRVRSDQPVVAERSMYWNDFLGGSGALGVPWDR